MPDDPLEGKEFREYPDGRVSPDDEGALMAHLGVDERHGRVSVHFGKQVAWVSLTPAQALEFARHLILKARSISTDPLTVGLKRVRRAAQEGRA